MWTVTEANDYSTLVWCESSQKLMIILHLSDVNCPEAQQKLMIIQHLSDVNRHRS